MHTRTQLEQPSAAIGESISSSGILRHAAGIKPLTLLISGWPTVPPEWWLSIHPSICLFALYSCPFIISSIYHQLFSRPPISHPSPSSFMSVSAHISPPLSVCLCVFLCALLTALLKGCQRWPLPAPLSHKNRSQPTHIVWGEREKGEMLWSHLLTVYSEG